MMDDLWWRDEDADYIRRRGERYPGASGIEPEWTLETARDPLRIVRDPDPKSRHDAIRIIGYSPSSGFVITVIATPSAHAGVTAWKTSGADLRVSQTGEAMTEHDRSARVDAEVRAIRAEYADEEAEAAEAAERSAALDVPLNLRIDRKLDAELKRRATAAQIPTSALVRRLLRQALRDPATPVLTEGQVEAIARRVLAEAKGG